MPTASAVSRHNAAARNFALRGLAWSLALFGTLRVAWFDAHAVLPLAVWQGRLAAASFGQPVLPVEVTLACSGADALALCSGAILAYPASWRSRLIGVAGGGILVVALNTLRIGTLGRAVGTPWFDALHVYAWPALLMLAIAVYVFAWMRRADMRAESRVDGVSATPFAAGAPGAHRRFVWVAAVCLVAFAAAAPWYLENAVVLSVAGFVARGAAVGLRALAIESSATGNVLFTARGAFLVTQECISTPLIPLYVAAVVSYLGTWPRRMAALLAAIPLFVALGMARLLVVALPAALVASPSFVIHAFYQMLLGAVLVVAAAVWRHGAGPAGRGRALLAVAAGSACCFLIFSVSGSVTSALLIRAGLSDPQRALAFLPAFQIGLLVALSAAAFARLQWRAAVTSLAVLGFSQVAFFAALLVMARVTGFSPHVRDVRGWAVAGPLLLITAVAAYERRGPQAPPLDHTAG